MLTDCQDGCAKFPWMFRELDSLHLVLHPVIHLGKTFIFMNHKIPRTANSGNIRIVFFRAFRSWPCIVPPQGTPAQGTWGVQQLPTGYVHWLGNSASCHQMFSGCSLIFWPLFFKWWKHVKTRVSTGCFPFNQSIVLICWWFFLSSQANPKTTTFKNCCRLISLEFYLGFQWTRDFIHGLPNRQSSAQRNR